MMFLPRVILFAVVIARVHVDGIPCSSFSSLANAIIALYDGIFDSGDDGDIQQQDITLLKYTRQNPTTPILSQTNDVSQINPDKPVIMYINGWLASPLSVYGAEMRDAYLARYDCTFIIVDWSKVTYIDYPTAVSRIPKAAQFLTQFFYLLNQQLGIDLGTVHLIGHSLGAQMAGCVGQNLITTYGLQLGRITGLDPAGPGFQNKPISQRLDASDARFVDSMHCNAGEFGYCGDVADVDFYVNGGQHQPSCPQLNLIQIAYYAATLSITDLKTQFAILFGCSHVLCVDYFVESISTSNFVGQSARNCPQPCTIVTTSPTYEIMGENCPTSTPSREYWVPTHLSSPYARGCPPSTVFCT